MRTLSILLLAAGTILGALGGARLPEIHLPLTSFAMALLLAGAVLFRLADRKDRQAEVAAGGASSVDDALQALPDRLDALVAAAPALPLTELVARLGALELEVLGPVGEAIPRFLPRLGGVRFAEVFGPYSAGERLVRRAWSAAADDHRPEALASLAEGAARIRLAVALLEESGAAVVGREDLAPAN